ncbi:HNH endonuclease [Erwiniaceae bacterium L1_54_6]|nr:HNH endonuclease [Erwiniaceae bacterium L1_54_6]
MKSDDVAIINAIKYDPESGLFTNLVKRGPLMPGDLIGCANHKGYVNIMVAGRMYVAHRLAWFLMKKRWPDGMVDHINRNPTDNRWCNLRLATRSQNGMNRTAPANNTSGRKGVCWCKRNEKWFAYIMLNQKQKSLGYYVNISGAISARERAEQESFESFNPNASAILESAAA